MEETLISLLIALVSAQTGASLCFQDSFPSGTSRYRL